MRFKRVMQIMGLCAFGVACLVLHRLGQLADEDTGLDETELTTIPVSGGEVPRSPDLPDLQPKSLPGHVVFDRAAAKLVAKLKAGEASAFDEFLDLDFLLHRATNGIEVDWKYRSDYARAIKKAGMSGIGRQIVKQISEGGDYVFLRSHIVEGEKDNQRVLFRLTLAGGGVNYHDMLVVYRHFDQVQAIDIDVMLSGELLSTTLRRTYLAGAAERNRNLLERLTQGESDFIRHQAVIIEMSNARESGQYQLALAGYQRLPDSLKRDKTFSLMHLLDATKLGNEALYLAASENFLKYHPNDPCADIVSLDVLIAKKEFDKALAAIDRIEESIGSDAYWPLMRGTVYMQRGDFRKAHQYLNIAERREGRFAGILWTNVTLSLREKKFAETARWLSRLRREFDVVFNDLAQLPEYAEFVKSPEYHEWLAAQPVPEKKSESAEEH